MIVAKYDGAWRLPGVELHQFTTLKGASEGTSWTVKPGSSVAERFSEVESRFRFARCPNCGHGVRALTAAYECAAGCGWQLWKREAAA